MSPTSRTIVSPADCLYKLASCERMDSCPSAFYQRKPLYGIVFVAEGSGRIVIDGRIHSLEPQCAFIAPPSSLVKIRLASGSARSAAVVYHIQFHALCAGEQGQFAPASLDCPDDLHPARFRSLLDKLPELEQKLQSPEPWDRMKANIVFQEWIAELFQSLRRERTADVHSAMRQTAEYMERHFQQPITREELAGIAGLHPDYFSRAFKKQFGVSPIDHLTAIRIRHAKRLLLQSDESFRTIARNVGFSDEFYFSRKFKAKTGHAPLAYVKKVRNTDKIASLNHVTTGHLLALGIEPYAAVLNNAYPIHARLPHTIPVGRSVPDLEKLISINPELILARGTRQTEKSAKERMIDQIAPTIVLDYAGSWRTHLLRIGKMIGKEKEADAWLERYETKLGSARRTLRAAFGHQRVLIVGIGNGRLCLFGQRNIGTVLYDDLQLGMPEAAASIAHYREIELGELNGIDADRILLTSYKHDGSPYMDQTVREQVRQLFASPEWRALPAVRSGNVHSLLKSRHLYTSYNAFSHDLLVDRMCSLAESL